MLLLVVFWLLLTYPAFIFNSFSAGGLPPRTLTAVSSPGAAFRVPAGRVMSYNLAPRCAALPWHAGTRARAGRRRGDAYDAEQTYDSSLAPARRGVHFVGNLSRDGLDERVAKRAQWEHSLWWGLDERVAAAEAVARPPGDAEVVVVRLAVWSFVVSSVWHLIV